MASPGIAYQQVVGRVMPPAFADVFVIAALDVWATGTVGDDGRVKRPPQLRECECKNKEIQFFVTQMVLVPSKI